MPKLCFTLILIGCISLSAYSQQYTISGSIIDTSENKPIQNAVVSILRPVDSLLLKFVRTTKDGIFSIPNLKSSRNIVLITYPGYADYADTTRESADAEIKLGAIPLTQRSQLLETVIVRQQVAAIRMKGDTLEYRADSFAVKEGSAVEDLLKRLPGITVDRSGKITAQGQSVSKVLVDGEEFFSDDPAVVIKNLQADAVDKVQVFDKKSDQAEFTGIDDGQRSKTINLTLKEDKKKGYFLKATAGGGTNGTFDNDVMTNVFKGAKKFAAFGIMSNTGRSDLDWREMQQFGEGYDREYDAESGGFSYSWDEGEDFSVGSEQGLPKAWSAGLHYSNKWRQEKEKINANYRFYKNNQRANSQTISQFILPDTQYFNKSSRQAFSSSSRHNAKGIYDLKFDSLSSVKITVQGNSVEGENASRMMSAALNADSGQVNSNDRTSNARTSRNTFNANLLWRRKFKTKGRTLSIGLEQQANEQESNGFLNSRTEFFDAAGIVDSTELIDQKKATKQNVLGVKSNITYTEPLSKSIFLSVNYGFAYRRNESFRTTLNKTGSDYDKRDSSLSNDFRFRYNMHSAGLDFKFNHKKLSVTVGSGINHSTYDQSDLLRDTALSYSFINYFPRVNLRWSPNQQRGLYMNYSGRNNPPTLEQLQPVRENSDPLNVRIGNPNLRQEFTHMLNFFFHDFKVLKNRGIFISTDFAFQDNAISNATSTDLGGKTLTQAINVDGNYNFALYFNYGWKAQKPNLNFDFGSTMTLNKYSNIVNGFSNATHSRNHSFNVSVGRYSEKHSFFMRPGIGYTISESSVRPDVVTKYLMSETEIGGSTKLPFKFEISTTAYLNLRQKTDVFDRNRNAIKWDAYLSKKFMKKDNLELRLSVFDILNQNIGFNRYTNTNIITENSYQNLRRYAMMSLRYNISKSPG